VITTQPQSQIAPLGGTLTLSVAASGTVTGYQWYDNGAAIPGATGPTLTTTNVTAAAAGTYTVAVIGSTSTVTSAPVLITVQAPLYGRLVDLAVRAVAGSGAQTLIVGFSVTGGNKPILLRGIGPSLAPLGVTGTLPDPYLTLYNSGSTVLQSNDYWAAIRRSPPPSPPLPTFPSGGQQGRRAPAHACQRPLHRVGHRCDRRLRCRARRNVRRRCLSAQCAIGRGREPADQHLRPCAGRHRRQYHHRRIRVQWQRAENAAHPRRRPLARPVQRHGILANPRLDLFDQNGTLLQSNDDWGGSATLSNAFTAVGAFPLNGQTSLDAVLLVTLPPGTYTAQVSGVNGTTGVALVEVYEMP